MRVEERLLSYVVVDTQSDEQSTASPSTEKQLVLAEMLKDELQGLGIENAHVDAYGVVYGKLEANAQGYPAIGLHAHMDTATDLTGTNVRPRIIRAYDGGIIDLNEEIQDVYKRQSYACVDLDNGQIRCQFHMLPLPHN